MSRLFRSLAKLVFSVAAIAQVAFGEEQKPNQPVEKPAWAWYLQHQGKWFDLSFSQAAIESAPDWTAASGEECPLSPAGALRAARAGLHRAIGKKWTIAGPFKIELAPLGYSAGDRPRVGPYAYHIEYGVVPSTDGETPAAGELNWTKTVVLLNGATPEVREHAAKSRAPLELGDDEMLPVPPAPADPKADSRKAEIARLQKRLPQNHRLAQPYLEVITHASGRSMPKHWLWLDEVMGALRGSDDEKQLAILILESIQFGPKHRHYLYRDKAGVIADGKEFAKLEDALDWLEAQGAELVWCQSGRYQSHELPAARGKMKFRNSIIAKNE